MKQIIFLTTIVLIIAFVQSEESVKDTKRVGVVSEYEHSRYGPHGGEYVRHDEEVVAGHGHGGVFHHDIGHGGHGGHGSHHRYEHDRYEVGNHGSYGGYRPHGEYGHGYGDEYLY